MLKTADGFVTPIVQGDSNEAGVSGAFGQIISDQIMWAKENAPVFNPAFYVTQPD